MAKWIEREIKRQKTQLFGRESSLPLANLFSNYPSQEKPKGYPSPINTQPSSPADHHTPLTHRDSTQSYASSSSLNSDFTTYGSTRYGEPSVEEPVRYGARLVEFVESVLA